MTNNKTYTINLLPIVVILAILKLAGIISWSWWVVTALIWIPLGILALCGVFMLLVLLFVGICRMLGAIL